MAKHRVTHIVRSPCHRAPDGVHIEAFNTTTRRDEWNLSEIMGAVLGGDMFYVQARLLFGRARVLPTRCKVCGGWTISATQPSALLRLPSPQVGSHIGRSGHAASVDAPISPT